MKAEMEDFFDLTYAHLKSRFGDLADHNAHDISDIFRDAREPYYIDFAHTSEAGNEVIAARMAPDIATLLRPDN